MKELGIGVNIFLIFYEVYELNLFYFICTT